MKRIRQEFNFENKQEVFAYHAEQEQIVIVMKDQERLRAEFPDGVFENKSHFLFGNEIETDEHDLILGLL